MCPPCARHVPTVCPTRNHQVRSYVDKKTGRFSIRVWYRNAITVYNALDYLRFVLVTFATSIWLQLLVNRDRSFDLNEEQYIDLESVGRLLRLYTTFSCSVLLVALFSLLQYSELNDKMAIITRTISHSLGDIAYFGLIR
jgi:hypothetical protein